MPSFFKSKIHIRQAGFTLMELLVVMGIAVVMITTLVIQQSKWNDRLAVNTQAYELALMIRQAQIYSLGVKEYVAGAGDKFGVGYGVYFNTDNTRYIFFADGDGDKKYDSGEAIETKTFTRGVTVKDVCGEDRCIFTGGGDMRQANISFLRPETKAIIELLNTGGNHSDDPPVVISLQSPNGKVTSVKVEENGQVSIMQ